MSVAVAVGLGAKLDRKIFRAPGQTLQPLARAAIGAGEEHRLRGFGGDGDDVERAVGQAVDRLARGDLGVAMDDGRAAFGLGKHDAIGTARHDGVEVVVGQAGGQSVDAHVKARALLRALASFRKRQRGGARLGLVLRRDRILEVEQQRIGAAAHALVELLRTVAGNEEEGAHPKSVRYAAAAINIGGSVMFGSRTVLVLAFLLAMGAQPHARHPKRRGFHRVR